VTEELPEDWREVLADTVRSPEYAAVRAFVSKERAVHTVYPPEGQVFTALRLTPYAKVKVLLLGQDPYHGPGQAQGLAFSVAPGVPPPPSLRNMFKELQADVGAPPPRDGSLVAWAEQGVLLLNAVLTVRAGAANSHAGHGWEHFTDAVIRAVSAKREPCVFLLWGRYAQKKLPLIDAERHVVMTGVHPSPLSAKGGFFGSRPFSRTNEALQARGRTQVRWELPAR
jgi:uracil-DNA glycosylase